MLLLTLGMERETSGGEDLHYLQLENFGDTHKKS